MTALPDLTLDELRRHIAPQVAEAAVFDGWSDTAVESAALSAGIDPAVARFAFADGAMAMIEAWVARIDDDMAAALPKAFGGAAVLQALHGKPVVGDVETPVRPRARRARSGPPTWSLSRRAPAGANSRCYFRAPRSTR